VAQSDDLDPASRAAEPSLAWLSDHGAAITLAEIWATVEIDRALTDLFPSGPPVGSIAAVVDDPLLGARVLVTPVAEGETLIALAEPSSEGRLAATLARRGEGPAGRYVRSPIDLDTLRDLATAAGVAVSRPAAGPFGPAIVVVTAVAGPHLILVGPSASAADPAAVPSPP
jgi:hypothetical protein